MIIITTYTPQLPGPDGWTEYGKHRFKIISPDWETGKAIDRKYVESMLSNTRIFVRYEAYDLGFEVIGQPALVSKKYRGLYVRFKLKPGCKWSEFGFYRKWEQRDAQDYLDREFASIYQFIDFKLLQLARVN